MSTESMTKKSELCTDGGVHDFLYCTHADGKGHPISGPQGCATTRVVDANGVEWTHEELGGFDYIEHRGGVSWFEAAPPPYRHKCQPQTRAFLRVNTVHRCACGAISMPDRGRPDEYWMERNQRVAKKSSTAADTAPRPSTDRLWPHLVAGLKGMLIGQLLGFLVGLVVLAALCSTVPMGWYLQGLVSLIVAGVAVVGGGTIGDRVSRR